jgi:hypothetical protein
VVTLALNHERLMQMFDDAQRLGKLKKWRAVADEFIRAQDYALRDARTALREAIARATVDQAQIEQLRTALRESLKLQSHYAKLLNGYDGGTRMVFEDIGTWLARLKETGTLEDKA